MLEPCAVKAARTVLRGAGGRKATRLPDLGGFPDRCLRAPMTYQSLQSAPRVVVLGLSVRLRAAHEADPEADRLFRNRTLRCDPLLVFPRDPRGVGLLPASGSTEIATTSRTPPPPFSNLVCSASSLPPGHYLCGGRPTLGEPPRIAWGRRGSLSLQIPALAKRSPRHLP